MVVCVPCEEEVFGEESCSGVEGVRRGASSIQRESSGGCFAGGVEALCEESGCEIESARSHLVVAAELSSGVHIATVACGL